MAHYVREKVRICEVGTIVSSETEEITAPDGSRHNVPVINCNALQYLRQNYEDNEGENNLSGESEEFEKYANDQQEEEMDEETENKEEIHESKLNYPDYFDSKQELFNFMLQNKIIMDEVRCENCRKLCTIREKRSIVDDYIWQCNKCKKNTSIRKGSVFEKNKVPLHTMFKIMHLWATGVPGHTAANLVRSVSSRSIYNIYMAVF